MTDPSLIGNAQTVVLAAYGRHVFSVGRPPCTFGGGAMMTVRSIAAQSAPAYAEYLDGKTVAAERGDYYLGRDGEPVQSPGRWLARPETLEALGISPGEPVRREDLTA